MAMTFNTKTYTADGYQKDLVTYTGAANTVSVKDQFRLGRTAAKPTDTYSGTSRFQVKATRTHTLTGAKTPTGDSIFDLGVNVPVGISDADLDAWSNDFGAFVSSSYFKDLIKKQKITN